MGSSREAAVNGFSDDVTSGGEFVDAFGAVGATHYINQSPRSRSGALLVGKETSTTGIPDFASQREGKWNLEPGDPPDVHCHSGQQESG
jgi:hypothetical protein